MSDNTLYYGDNLDLLRRDVKDETVDLVYLDPPFNPNATYNVLFAEQLGVRAEAFHEMMVAGGGFYHSPGWNKDYPRIQIPTVAELLAGKGIDMPPLGQISTTFKKAPKAMATAQAVPLPFGQ